MKTFKFFTLNIALLLLIAGTMTFVSCEEETGPPEIHGVRITDPTQADSLFAQTPAGRMIVIVGKNLQNAKEIYINDQKVSFNANYNTSTHIIVSIPSEEDGFILTYFDPALKSEIRVETDRGVASYRFLVTFPFPEITAIDAEEYPTPTGDKMTITGYNFVDIKKVYFTNINSTKPTGGEVRIEVPAFTVENNRYLDKKSNRYITESVMEFVLPELPRNADGNYTGYLAIECAASTVFRRYSTLPEPIIKMLSSDMPIPGMKLIIEGLFFIDVEYVDINNGEIVIPVENMTEVSRTKLSFIMPAKPSKSCDLKIVASNGVGIRKRFYPYEQLLTDFNEIGKYENWSSAESGGTVSFQPTEENPATGLPAFNDGKFALMRGTGRGTWWGPALCMFKNQEQTENILPSYDYIPAKTPSSEVYLAYECYNKQPFSSTAFVRYELLDKDFQGSVYFNYDWGAGQLREVCHPGYDGVPLFNQWYTVMVPLSKFEGYEDMTYGEIYDLRFVMFHFVLINPTEARFNVDIMFDNIRFVIIPK